jgi:hypothetical protein
MNYIQNIPWIVCPSDGRLKGALCQGSQPLWHAKDRFPDVRKRIDSLKAVKETQKFQTQQNSLYYISTWLQIEFLSIKITNAFDFSSQ